LNQPTSVECCVFPFYAIALVFGGADEMGSSMKPTPTLDTTQQFAAYDYLARARAFREAAHLLPDIHNGQPNWPKYFLLGHAIELALKAVEKYCQQSPRYQKPSGERPKNHDLVGWYEWAKLHGLPSNGEIEKLMPHLSELHLEHFARYPQPLRGVMLISDFDDLVDNILSEVSKFLKLTTVSSNSPCSQS
jgi:hypothetical protein